MDQEVGCFAYTRSDSLALACSTRRVYGRPAQVYIYPRKNRSRHRTMRCRWYGRVGEVVGDVRQRMWIERGPGRSDGAGFEVALGLTGCRPCDGSRQNPYASRSTVQTTRGIGQFVQNTANFSPGDSVRLQGLWDHTTQRREDCYNTVRIGE